VEREPETPRICVACGANATNCPWCTGGCQTNDQRKSWEKFRAQTRRLSDTHSLLVDLVGEMVRTLIRINTKESIELAQEGREILELWVKSVNRHELSAAVSQFQKDAVEVISHS
jgi:hypothetical protein